MRIAHLSDIHYSNVKWHQELFDTCAMPALIADLKKYHADLPIDLVVISGDLINRGGISFKNQDGEPSPSLAFKTFEDKFIKRIATEIGLPPLNFILAPGNHDVDRSADSEIDEIGTKGKLISNPVVTDYIANNPSQGIQRILPYKKFEAQFYSSDSQASLSNFHSFFKRNVSSQSIGIAGINSSWRAYNSETDAGQLIIGEMCLKSGYRYISESDFKIAILHHPLDHLVEFEREYIESFLCSSFDLVLFGHQHKGKDHGIMTGNGDQVIYSSAPGNWHGSYDTDNAKYRNGYEIIDVASDKIIITHRMYLHSDSKYTINGERGKEGISNYSTKKKIALVDFALSRGCLFAKDINNAWYSIENSTIPPITCEMVISDREKQSEEFIKKISNGSQVITIQSNTSKESLAFILALMKTRKDLKELQDKSIAVSNIEDFKIIARHSSPLIIITPIIDPDDIAICLKNKHVIVLADSSEKKSLRAEVIKLPKPSFESFVKSLEANGTSLIVAEKITKECGASFSVFQRINSRIASVPDWATKEHSRVLIAAMFAQQWMDKRGGDKEIISILAKCSYEEFEGELRKWEKSSDSPIFKLADVWKLTSPIDCWFAIAKYVEKTDLDLLKSVAITVLTSKDPTIDLPPEERWLANVKNVIPHYSATLRRGLAQSLAYIAVLADKTGISEPNSMQQWVDSVVGEILSNKEAHHLFSISDVMRLLAEASPSKFLDCIEKAIKSTPDYLKSLFSESKEQITSTTRHTYLLWALEAIAWDPKYLARASLILCDLCELDPGGNLSNRPFSSLVSLFQFWYPQTFANLNQRLSAISMIIKRRPRIAMNLCLALAPSSHHFASGNAKFELRDEDRDFEIRVLRSDLFHGATFIVKELLNLPEVGAKFWIQMLDIYPNLPPNDRKQIVEKLTERLHEVSGDHSFIRKLRDFLSKHKKYSSADWAIPGDELNDLHKVFKSISGTDGIGNYLWLFDSHFPNYIDECALDSDADFEKNASIAQKFRSDALIEITNKFGLTGIESLVNSALQPQLIGNALADISNNSFSDDDIINKLTSDTQNEIQFSTAYVSAKSYRESEWWQRIIEKRKANSIPLFWKRFLPLIPFSNELIETLSTLAPDIQTLYWKECSPLIFVSDKPLAEFALEKYASYGRLLACLNILTYSKISLTSDNIMKALEIPFGNSMAEGDIKHIESYQIQELFSALYSKENIDENRLKRLEWYYFPFLTNGGYQGTVKHLHNDIVTIPEFFVQILSNIYMGDNERDNAETPTEQTKALWKQSYDLLKTCKMIPGGGENPSIEETNSWVSEAMDLCSKAKRDRIGKTQIGTLLANGFKISGGSISIVESVLDAIERNSDEDIDCGFETEIYNSRGVVMGSMAARESSDSNFFLQYSEYISTSYPHVGSVIQKISENYRLSSIRSKEQEELGKLLL